MTYDEIQRLKDWKARAERWMWLNDIRPCDIAACKCGLWHGGEKSWEARYREVEHQRDKALEDYEIAMHRVAQLEAANAPHEPPAPERKP